MPEHSDIVSKIRDRVRTADQQTLGMRQRMVEDQLLFSLDPFEWWKVGERIPPNTPRYTSNEPKVLAQTAITMLTQARLTYTAPRESAVDDYLKSGRMAEQLFAGFMRQVDDQQTVLVNPTIRRSLAFYCALRGFVIGLHVLTKDEETWETVARMEAWDPFNVYWGRDYKGIAWACHYQDLDSYRMEARFGPSAITGYQPSQLSDKDATWRVYDYYDRDENIVMIGERIALRQKHFGSHDRVPVTIVPVGAPLVVSPNDGFMYDRDFGESIYAANRELYPKLNAILSAKYARVVRAINPAVGELSDTGRPFIPQEVASPYDMGLRLRMNALNHEAVIPIEEPEMPRETAELEGTTSGQLQRGGVPHIVHGQSSQQSSGYNTSLLLGSSQFLVEPRLEAMSAWYKSAEQHFRRQFSSGFFDAVRLQGQVSRQKSFDVMIEPAMIKDAPPLHFDMRLVNPQEIAQKIALAQMLREGPYPLVDDNTIRDVYMEVEDPDFVGDLVAMQTAWRATPKTQLILALQAAVENGDDRLAQALMGELMMEMQQPGQVPVNQGGQSQGALPGPGSPRPRTEAGGSPRAGQPNQSDERQLGGRPREAGVR